MAAQLDRAPGREFVGRRAELDDLRARLEQARAGRLELVVVEGEPGVGKTTLVSEFVAGLGKDSVLEASADEAEAAITFGTVAQLAAAAPVRPPASLGALTTPDGQAAPPMHVGAGLVALAGQLLTGQRALVLIVDNAHWADAASQQALAFALRRLRGDPVLCLLVMPAALPVRLSDGLARLLAENATRLRLAGFTPGELRELASGVTRRPLSARAAARVHGLTGGNPLHARALLEELPDDVLDRGADPLPAPRSFGLVVLARLAGCGPQARALAVAASVLGVSCRLADAARLAEVAGDDGGLAALEECLAASLLEEGATTLEHRVVFPHPLVRAAVYRDLGPARRSALHAAAARIVDDPDSRLRHRVAACAVPDEALAAEVEAAGRIVSEQGNWLAAADHLLAAAKVSPDRGDRERRFVDGVSFLLYGGETARAAAHLAEVPDLADGPRRDYIRARLAVVEGGIRDALDLLGRAWEALDSDADPHLARAVAEQLAQCNLAATDVSTAAEWGLRALALGPPPPGVPSSLADVLLVTLADTGRTTLAHEILAKLPVPSRKPPARVGPGGPPGETGRAPGDSSWPDGLTGRGAVLLAEDDLDGAAAAFRLAYEVYRERGLALPYGLISLLYLADVEYRTGAWDEALVRAEQARSIAVDADQEWQVPLFHAVASYTLSGQGRPGAAELIEAAADHPVIRAGHGSTVVMMARARLEHARGDFPAVAGALAAFEDIGLDEIPEPSWLAWRPFYAEALAHLGELDHADSILRVYEDGALARGHRTGQLLASRARGIIQAARGDTAGASAAFREGLRVGADRPVPFERALLELDFGAHLRRAGRRSEAGTLLEQARERLVRLGAEPYLARCERELAACGRAPVRRAHGIADTLTPQELTVARLVTKGLSNREVAGELVLSVKTIEYHLGNVYAKLGLRSRGQLTAALRTTP